MTVGQSGLSDMIRFPKNPLLRIAIVLGIPAVMAMTAVAILNLDGPKKWRTERASKRFIEALRAQGDSCRGDLVPAIQALQERLLPRHIKLTVVLAPTATMHFEKGEVLHPQPRSGCGVIFTAERELRAAGLRVLNLMPDWHRAVMSSPDLMLMAADGLHYSDSGGDLLAEAFLGRLKPELKEKGGRESLLIGDCYAQLLGQRLRSGETMPRVRDLWRNAGSPEMGREISGIPPGQLKGVRQIYWILPDGYLRPQEAPKFPFPPLREPPKEQALEGEPRVLKVTVTRGPVVSHEFHQNAPYPSALIANEFRTEAGEAIAGLSYALRDRRPVNGAILYGYAGQPMTLTVVPWDAAVAANPVLRTEQVIDSAPDFTLPRYFVQGWFHGH
jgi:hypothetical protein